jgi:hypothetical protein
VACYYSLDGGPDVLYGYMCGNVLIMPANTGNVLSGNSLSIKIYAGNQNPAETYRIDNVVVSYLPKTTPTFNQLGPYCVGDTLELYQIIQLKELVVLGRQPPLTLQVRAALFIPSPHLTLSAITLLQ